MSIVGDSTGISGDGNLSRSLLVLREVVVVVGCYGDFNAKKHDAMFSPVVGCLRVVPAL
ncbi:hypothetical protein L195_g052865 [Trifolium pratense]|uniref:Uncharacterized protein n=1 Tax=Trifolium pratense TaxID=57577 RepID=A0A2K3K7I1_TRIPR|nr:hypothetical protein L195_g052865 [Trifolium pratense]